MDRVARRASAPRGLAGFAECEHAGAGFEPGTVHDLRVALRRCRTMADSLQRVDDDPGWRAAKKSGKKLFHRLGALRDVQVMAEWTLKLGGPGDAARLVLLARLLEREEQLKKDAKKALKRFPAGRWKTLTRRLSARAARFEDDGEVFVQLARDRLTDAWTLHRAALARETPDTWHRLRIGAKRFRYVVENFLPRRHEAWGEDLKRLQDLLGAVHDLDLLRDELAAAAKQVPYRAVERWNARIDSEREQRLAEYRKLTSGRGSPWSQWRRELNPLPDAAAAKQQSAPAGNAVRVATAANSRRSGAKDVTGSRRRPALRRTRQRRNRSMKQVRKQSPPRRRV
jgi:CHAD domain-containing protein